MVAVYARCKLAEERKLGDVAVQVILELPTIVCLVPVTVVPSAVVILKGMETSKSKNGVSVPCSVNVPEYGPTLAPETVYENVKPTSVGQSADDAVPVPVNVSPCNVAACAAAEVTARDSVRPITRMIRIIRRNMFNSFLKFERLTIKAVP